MPKPKATRSEQLSFRAEPALVKRIDDLRAAMKKRLRGVDLSRSDLLKTLIEQALPPMEMEYMRRVPGMTVEELAEWIGDTTQFLGEMADQLDLKVPKRKRK